MGDSRNLLDSNIEFQASGGDSSKLVSKVAAEAVEMAYWLVKFVGDFEKVFKESKARIEKYWKIQNYT